jgi:hypothetical protein
MSTVCIIQGNFGQFFILTQEVPLLIGMIFSGFVYITGSIFFAACGFYLFFASYFLWPFQAYINQIRSPLLCPIGSAAYEFPCMEMFYVSSIITIVIWHTIFFRGRPGVLSWLWMVILFGAAAFILCFFQFNIWYEVLFSAAIGLVMTSIFMLHMVLFFCPSFPYLECVPPFTISEMNDSLGYGYNALKYTNFKNCRKQIHRIANVDQDKWKVKQKKQ